MKRYGFCLDDEEAARYEAMAKQYVAGKVGNLAVVALREYATRKEAGKRPKGAGKGAGDETAE